MQGFNLIRRVLPVFALLSQCSSAWMFMSSSAASKQQYGSVRAQSKTMTRRTLTNTILTGLATSGAFTTINSAAIAAAGVAFQGSFSDPNHPNCPRLIAVEGSKASLNGADGNPGCPTGNGKEWHLEGTISGKNIFVDFSPKGGPKDLNGVWEEGNEPGIRWPDGNKWSLKTKLR